MKRLTGIADKERWLNISTRLSIRDTCKVGKEKWRYEGAMLDYFYPIKETRETVLHRCTKGPLTTLEVEYDKCVQ